MRIEGNDQRLAAATAIQLQQSGVQQALSPKTQQSQDAQQASKENTVQSIAGDKVSINVELPKHTVDTLQKMGNISDFLNSAAISLRQSNEGLKESSGVVAGMKTSLDNIIKVYPPYSIENKARIEQLMAFSSLRKQIISLMVPAPPPPVYEKVKHLWENLFSGPSNSIQIPTLPHNAPDSHVTAASKQLDVIAGQINLVRETMNSSVMRT